MSEEIRAGARRATVAAVDATLRARRTSKVLASEEQIDAAARGEGGDTGVEDRAAIEAAIAVAGLAPFHYPRPGGVPGEGALEPWRFHLFDRAACGRFIRLVRRLAADPTVDDPKWASPGKIPALLAASVATVLVTWRPEPADGPANRQQRDEEHIAATAAATQNLLLAATARGFETYWSSGGVLRKPLALERCGIDAGERVLGSVFLFAADGEHERRPGALREQRSAPGDWSRWIGAEDIGP